MGRLLDKMGMSQQKEEEDELPYFSSAEEEYEGYEDGGYKQNPYPSIPPNYRQEEEYSPLSIIEEIKKDPTPKGECETVISGVPVDVHALEDYVVRISHMLLKQYYDIIMQEMLKK